MARLLIKSDGFGEQVIELKLGVNRFGRSPKCDFQIEHPTISGLHCEVEISDGSLLLRDCNSTNGTFVGGQPVKEAILREGQTFCLGDVVFFVENAQVRIAIPQIEVVDHRPAPPVVLADGGLVCPRHPTARATYQCTHCAEVLCEDCLRILKRRGGKVHKMCPKCSHECELIGADKKKKKKSLFSLLTKTIKLPFTHQNDDPAEDVLKK
jgi:hypothetical protein